MKNFKTIVPIILTLIGLGAGFAGGYFYRNHQLLRNRNNFAAGARFGANFGRGTGQGMGMMGRGGVFGSIISSDDRGITVKLADGSSKIILFTDSTTYSNTTSASKSDLKTGSEVAVFGATNSDGSVSATNIQINPMFARITPSPSPK